MIVFNVIQNNDTPSIHFIEAFKTTLNVNKLFSDMCTIYDNHGENFNIDILFQMYNCKKATNTKEKINLYVDIKYDKYALELNISNTQHLIYSKIHYNIDNKKGNCIDEFIMKNLDSKLYSLHNFIDDIKGRQYIRSKTDEYHQNSCYENDFASLSQIRDILMDMSIKCNQEIMKLSDKYTKN